MLRLTLVDPASADQPVELAVRCGPGATVGDLRGQLVRLDLLAPDDPRPLYAGSTILDDGATVGLPPLLEGAVITLGASPGRADPRPGPLQLLVTSGPDAGRSHPLGAGQHVFGRGPGVSLRAADASLSRAHLGLDVGPGGVSARDLGTTNGSWLDEQEVGPSPTPWRAGQRLRAGSSVLELRVSESASAATTFDGQGHILVNRRPRVQPPQATVEVRRPPEPTVRDRARLSFLTMAIPLLLALPLAWLQHSPAYLMFGLMSPAMMIGTHLGDRRGGRRDERRQRATWRRACEQTDAALRAALEQESVERRHRDADYGDLLQIATGPLARLWERRPSDPDWLRLRLGLGQLPSRVVLVEPSHVEPGPASTSHPLLRDVPVCVDLAPAGVLGLAGPAARSHAFARGLVAQLAGWHSPIDLQLVVVAADDALARAWSWAGWLPQARPEAPDGRLARIVSAEQGAALGRLLTELDVTLDAGERPAPTQPSGQPATTVVVLLGAHRLRSIAHVQRLLERGRAAGVHAICVDERTSELPVECRAVIELGEGTDGCDSAAVTLPSGDRLTFVPDCPGRLWAERFARAMAPLRDATPGATTGLPPSASLLDLLGHNVIQPEWIAAAWGMNRQPARAQLGVSADGSYVVDLGRDGPHVLVGGTTGSGKSELLQTLIASLALANGPDELGFVLIDYKGGSAFAECARLPHALGLVTDLDEHLADRALTSLTAELKRRESILRAAGAVDLDDLVSRIGEQPPGLPRLVLVVDEFRMLAEELPAFLDGIVRIAALGRSLGMHLVLATQRPAGVISADIAANVNLRIALRVRDRADSEDVVEARDAASISAATPGRACARSGSGPLVAFQTARVGGTSRPRAQGCAVQVVDLARLGERQVSVETAQPAPGCTDLSLIVEATGRAAGLLGHRPARRPWLPPLPDLVTLGDLAARTAGWRVPYAVVDRPAAQAQETIAWDLEHDSHLAVVGTMRTGRSTALRTIAGSIARSFSTAEVHLHAVDGGAGALLALSALPHVGVVSTADELGRGTRLLDRLSAEVSRRRALLATGGFSSLAEQRRHSARADGLPYLVLLIDGWEGVSSAWEAVELGRPVETLHHLMRDGVGVGLRVAISGDRGLLLSRTASLVSDKIVLRMADPTDLMLAGIAKSAAPQHFPPGRGVRSADAHEVQIALLSADPSGPAQVEAIRDIAAQAARTASHSGEGGAPLRIEPLPTRVAGSDLSTPAGDRPRGSALVGVGGDGAEPIWLQLLGTTAVVAGPGRSGRSTLLATLAGSLTAHGCPVVGIASERSALGGLRGQPGVFDLIDPRDAAQLIKVLAGHPACIVVADDVERLLDTETEDVVLQWFKESRGESHGLLVAGNAGDLAAMFRGLSVVARRSGQGVLLNPTSYADGDLLGVRLGPDVTGEPRHPGRGVLVVDGVVTPVQAALPS